MGLTAELAGSVGIPVQRSGSLELIASSDANGFLDECARAGVRVLGIEGFRLADAETRPDTSAIADLSAIEDPNASVEEARAAVVEISEPDLSLEFTLTRGSG